MQIIRRIRQNHAVAVFLEPDQIYVSFPGKVRSPRSYHMMLEMGFTADEYEHSGCSVAMIAKDYEGTVQVVTKNAGFDLKRFLGIHTP